MSFRVRAFLWHCVASVCLALAAIALVFGIWYPAPLHTAAGVTTIFLVLLGVDVVIGPLLTLVVANKEKKSIKWDLSIIVVLQLAAFSYGMYTVANGRPIWLVFNVERFDMVQAYELKHKYRDAAPEQYRGLSFFGPDWVAAQRPEANEDRETLMFESVFAGIDLPQRPDLYVPYSDLSGLAAEKSFPLADLEKYNSVEDVNAELAKWPEADAFLPMMAQSKAMTVLLNIKQGKIIAVVPLNPWP